MQPGLPTEMAVPLKTSSEWPFTNVLGAHMCVHMGMLSLKCVDVDYIIYVKGGEQTENCQYDLRI